MHVLRKTISLSQRRFRTFPPWPAPLINQAVSVALRKPLAHPMHATKLYIPCMHAITYGLRMHPSKMHEFSELTREKSLMCISLVPRPFNLIGLCQVLIVLRAMDNPYTNQRLHTDSMILAIYILYPKLIKKKCLLIYTIIFLGNSTVIGTI